MTQVAPTTYTTNNNTNQKKLIIYSKDEFESLDAPPLDFSFKNITDLAMIVKIEPRKGKRKPIPIIEEESKEDDKKKKPAILEETKLTEQSQIDNNEEESPNEGEKKPEVNQKTDEEKEKEEQLRKQQEIKIIPESHIISVLTQHNHTLQNISKAPGKMGEEGKLLQVKKVKVKLVCSSLILSYNQIKTLDNFHKFIDQVMFDSQKLLWLDLAHNHLVTLSPEICKFPNLKTLNLHKNYIFEFEELYKLQPLQNLKSLTIHGNPIDTISGFRIIIIGILPTLKKLDTVLISAKEYDNSKWIKSFKGGKLPKCVNPEKPPLTQQPKKEEQTE